MTLYEELSLLANVGALFTGITTLALAHRKAWLMSTLMIGYIAIAVAVVAAHLK